MNNKTDQPPLKPLNPFGSPRTPLPKTPLPELDRSAIARTDAVAEAVGFPSREREPGAPEAGAPSRRIRPRAEPARFLNMRMPESEYDRFVDFANAGVNGRPFASYREALTYLLDLAARGRGGTK